MTYLANALSCPLMKNICSVYHCRILRRSRDDTKLYYQLDSYFHVERVVLLFRDMFKWLGSGQFLAIDSTSQEAVPFHGNDFVALRFAHGLNESSVVGSHSDIMVHRKAKRVSDLGAYFAKRGYLFP